MPSLGMQGPYAFDESNIEKVVTKTSPGNYALGYTNNKDGFVVEWVGRSDTDVNHELKARLSVTYKQFKYSYATSAKDAFEKECYNYHDFGGADELDNKIHPDRPDETDWKCPVCNIFE